MNLTNIKWSFGEQNCWVIMLSLIHLNQAHIKLELWRLIHFTEFNALAKFKILKTFYSLGDINKFILNNLIRLDGNNGEDGDILFWHNWRYDFGEINSFGKITKLNRRIQHFIKVITIAWRLAIIFTWAFGKYNCNYMENLVNLRLWWYHLITQATLILWRPKNY